MINASARISRSRKTRAFTRMIKGVTTDRPVYPNRFQSGCSSVARKYRIAGLARERIPSERAARGKQVLELDMTGPRRSPALSINDIHRSSIYRYRYILSRV